LAHGQKAPFNRADLRRSSHGTGPNSGSARNDRQVVREALRATQRDTARKRDILKDSDFLHYLWRAVGQDGEIFDIFLQRRRDGKAAKRFFKRLLKAHRNEPRKMVTDKLKSYGVAHRELIPYTIHDTCNMPIIAPNCPISQGEFENGSCVDLNHCDRLNAFYMFMRLFTQIQSWPSPCFSQEL